MSDAVQELIDRQRIYECLLRYTRGMDRLDRELVLSAYHPDAMEDHGPFMAPAAAFVEQVLGFHRDTETCTQHILHNHACEIEGDVAHCETYVSCYSVYPTGKASLSFGRFIDRFEKRNGDWRITDRASLNEGSNEFAGQVSPPHPSLPNSRVHPTRDKNDPSYARPLRIHRG